MTDPGSPQWAGDERGKYYLVRIPLLDSNGRQPRDVKFHIKPGVAVPADYIALHIDIEKTLTVLNILFPDQSRDGAMTAKQRENEYKFQEYYGKLASLSLAALGQDQVALGRMALTGLQDEVLAREAGHVKNTYIRRLGTYAVLLAVPVVILYFVADCMPPDTVLHRFRHFLAMITGSFLGTWLSFSIRRVTLSFWDLARLEEDRLDPGVRLLFVAGLTIFVGLVLTTKVMTLTLGQLSTAALTSGTIAALIGMFCGVGEQGLSAAVARRASEFIDALGGARDARPPSPPPPPGPPPPPEPPPPPPGPPPS